ncbi:MAG: RNA polymerase factor sigma-54 [Paludibacteraceae bacterium]|nr:RNA polymerase factor sigma-54 [Paludibacteraceae bacterium]
MALKQQFQQKLQQKLSPLQLQIIKLLEFSVLEFEEKIKTELEENPALEEGVSEEDVSDGEEELSDTETDELFDVADYMDDGDDADYSMPKDPNANSSGIYSIPQSEGESFHEHLLSQLNLLPISEQQFLLAEYVVGNIDEEGYLRREIAQIATDISIVTGTNITESALFEILAIVQQLEPSGVGARSLQECLLLQLQRKKITPSVDIAMHLLEEYFTEFSNKHYDKIMAKLEIDDDTLRAAIEEIVHLNPKPGNGWNGLLLEKNKEAITPDFVLESQEGQLSLSLNSNHIPSLRVNHVYVNLFQDFVSNKANQTQSMKDAVSFAKQKLDAAKSFIDAVKQREETLLKVTTAIVNFQRQYFYEGSDAFLRPMTMKDIAEISGYDISTISRVANSKYIQTNFGVFPLRYFFTEGMLTQSGEEVSTREIKNILVQCIEEEDKKKPLSDDKLTEILQQKGYNIARRTVAKYREQLDIPVARLRKEM